MCIFVRLKYPEDHSIRHQFVSFSFEEDLTDLSTELWFSMWLIINMDCPPQVPALWKERLCRIS